MKDRGSENSGQSQNQIVFSARLHQEVRDLAALHWPEEVCGLLIASKDSPNRIGRVVVARNVADDPQKTFEIDPQTLFDTHRAVRTSNETIVGCFHSHPNGNVLPSNTDRERADEDGFLWLIIATTHTGAGASGMYRIVHQTSDAPDDGANIRYFQRCKLTE
ncbi:Mov34/MPN/PAD-1 family protein [Thalassospira lucentensis]|uniref:Mov34/MPN/PAD-1 family protein n=1 Tax=Thalassospira lucentensis TaxID=168935 RepID=UPI003AA7C2A0